MKKLQKVFIPPREYGPPLTLELPYRWFQPARNQPRAESVAQLTELGKTFVRAAVAVADVYLRICDHIRWYELDPDEVSKALAEAGFPPSRVSEIKRVAYAPDHIWKELQAREIGFRVALQKSRMYYENRKRELPVKRRKLRRACARVLRLLRDLGEDSWEYQHKSFAVIVSRVEPAKPIKIAASGAAGVLNASEVSAVPVSASSVPFAP
ncbi:MAG TPA: hypothetical protein VK530_10665 [Candidatus Acidoferrum sp.]|nr:hypothetical protein [Candidatus Acidoferrum sp.]